MTAVAKPTRPPRRYVAPCPGCGSTQRRRYVVDPPDTAIGRNLEPMRHVDCQGCGRNLHRFPANIAKGKR